MIVHMRWIDTNEPAVSVHSTGPGRTKWHCERGRSSLQDHFREGSSTILEYSHGNIGVFQAQVLSTLGVVMVGTNLVLPPATEAVIITVVQ